LPFVEDLVIELEQVSFHSDNLFSPLSPFAACLLQWRGPSTISWLVVTIIVREPVNCFAPGPESHVRKKILEASFA